jgi:hypothetical protein
MRTTATITDTIHREFLAQYKIHTEAAPILMRLIDTLESLKDKKMFLKQGNKSAVFTRAMEELKLPSRTYIEKLHKSLYIRFNPWVSFGTHIDSLGKESHSDGNYYEAAFYIGDVNDEGFISLREDVKERLTENIQKTLTYTWEDIENTRHQIDRLDKQKEALHSKLPYYARKR